MAGNYGNIFIKNPGGSGFFLFTTRDGLRLPKILKRALIRGRNKWGDTPSLSRIIFSEMIQKEVLGDKYFGISTEIIDNENYILVVDDVKRLVGFFDENGRNHGMHTFDQFVAMEDFQLEWHELIGNRYPTEGIDANTPYNNAFPM